LEQEILSVEEQLGEEKAKRLREYESQKSGLSVSRSKPMKSSFQEVENFENKLMRANQKLNELSSNNNKLREKINQLRKEKNAMEDIYSKLKS
jgi:chromosome segregation ATPase